MSDSIIARYPERKYLDPSLFRPAVISKRSPAKGLLFGANGLDHPLLAVDWEGEAAVIDFDREGAPLYMACNLGSSIEGALLEKVEFRIDPLSAVLHRRTRDIGGALILHPSGTMHITAWQSADRDRDPIDVPIVGKGHVKEGSICYRSWAAGVTVDGCFSPILTVAPWS